MDRLAAAVERHHLAFGPGAEEPSWADLVYRTVKLRASHAGLSPTEITIPVMDEYDDVKAGNPVVALHLVVSECVMFEDAEDFLEWAADAGLQPADPRARDIYVRIGEVVPQIRAIVGTDLEPVSNYDFEFNTGVARALRSAK